jgi:DNA-directed RNA polymerase subunit N (RpoN/RPB10)
MLLLDGIQSFCCRWTLIRALEVVDEHGIQLVLVVDSTFG